MIDAARVVANQRSPQYSVSSEAAIAGDPLPVIRPTVMQHEQPHTDSLRRGSARTYVQLSSAAASLREFVSMQNGRPLFICPRVAAS